MSYSVLNTPFKSTGVKHSRDEAPKIDKRSIESNKRSKSESSSSHSNWGSRLYQDASSLLNDPNMRPLAHSLFPQTLRFDQLALQPHPLKVVIYPREQKTIRTKSSNKTVLGRARIQSLSANNKSNTDSILIPIPSKNAASASSSSQTGQLHQTVFEPIRDLHQALEKMARFNDQVLKQPIGTTLEGDLSYEMKELFRSPEYQDCVAAHAEARVLLYYLMTVAFSDVKNDFPTIRNQGAALQMHKGGHEKLAACHHTLLANIQDNYLPSLQNFLANQLFSAFEEKRSIDPHLILKLLVLGVKGKQIQEIVEDCFSVYRELDEAEAKRAARGYPYDINYVNNKFLEKTAQKIETIWKDTLFKPNPISLPDPDTQDPSFCERNRQSLFNDASRFTYLNNQCLIGWQLNPVDDVIERSARIPAEIELQNVARGVTTPIAAVVKTTELINSNFELLIKEQTHLVELVNKVTEAAKELETAEYRLTNMGLSDHSQLLNNWCQAAEKFQNANVVLVDYIQGCKTLTPEIINSSILNEKLVAARHLDDRLKITKNFLAQIEATCQEIGKDLAAKVTSKQQELETLKESEEKIGDELNRVEQLLLDVVKDPVWQEAEKLGWNADISKYSSYDKHRSSRDAVLKSIVTLGGDQEKKLGNLFNSWKAVVNKYYSAVNGINNTEKKFEKASNTISTVKKEIEELKLNQTALAEKKENHLFVKEATEDRARTIRHMHYQEMQQQKKTQKPYQCPIDCSVINQLIHTAKTQLHATETAVTKLRQLNVETQSTLIAKILSPYIIQRNFTPVEKTI